MVCETQPGHWECGSKLPSIDPLFLDPLFQTLLKMLIASWGCAFQGPVPGHGLWQRPKAVGTRKDSQNQLVWNRGTQTCVGVLANEAG